VQKISVILNPKSGRGQGALRRPELEHLLTEAAQKARHSGGCFKWEILETHAPGHGIELAAQAVEQGADIVAAAGGDGTLNEVVNGLVGTGARLGLLPFGTGNDCARHLGIGTDLAKGVQTVLFGRPHPADLGRVHGRWFINVAGCGFDAVVAERVNRGFRTLRGTSAYIAAVIHSLMTFPPARLRLTVDGELHELRALMCSVANTSSYGGGMRIAPDAQIDDGLFDICVIKEAGRVEFLRAFPRVFRGLHTTHPKVLMFRARNVLVESDPPLPVLIDGDIFGTTPAEFTLTPHAIDIMVPE
jgi:diacylglycerol kinase (ATP)